VLITPHVIFLAAEILGGLVLFGMLFILIKRGVRWYFLRTLERRVEQVRKILHKHRQNEFQKTDRLLFQLSNVQDQEAVEIALHEVLDQEGDTIGPRLRKVYDSLGLLDDLTKTLESSSRWVKRAEAARGLGQLQVIEAIPLLVARMRDPHEDVKTVKQAAAQALGCMKADETIPLLLDELASPEDWASPHIAEQLLAFGEKVVEPLEKALVEGASVNSRVWAAQILGRIGDRRSTMKVVARLQDRSEQVRISATEALGRLKDRRAVPELTRLSLRDPVAMVRSEAARALGEIGDRSVLSELVGLLASGDYWTRLRAVEAIEKLKPDDTSAMEQALVDESQVVRGEAARALERLGVLDIRLEEIGSRDLATVKAATASLVRFGKAGAVESLIRTARHDSMKIRARICTVLGDIGDNYALPAVTELLKDSMWIVRARAAQAIGKLSPDDPVALLAPSLSDDEEMVRIAAIEALRCLRPGELAEHLPALLQLFETGSPDARRSVIESIEAAPTEGVRALLLEALRDPFADVRYQAVREVAGRNDLDCTAPLTLLLGDAEQRVRMEAARALGEEASKQGIEALVASLSTPDREFREILSDLLAPLGVDRVMELIGNPEDVHRRLALAWTLGKTGDPAALEELRRLSRDGEAQVRAAAAGALGKIDLKESAGILVELMVDPDSRVRAAAVNGIGQLGKPDMLPLLLERTDEPSRFVLGRLAVALGLMGIKLSPGDPGGSGVLDALKKIEKRLQGTGRRALAYIGFGLTGFREGVNLCLDALADPGIEPKVWKALQGEPGSTRERFRRTLDLGSVGRSGELQAGRLRERFIHQLQNSREDDRRVEAILSLRAVGVGNGMDALLKAIASDPAPEVRRTALECIAPDYRDDRVGGALRRALRDPVAEVQAAAVSGLSMAEDPSNNQILMECGASGEDRVMESVLDALASANQGNVLEFAKSLHREEDPAIRALGATALGMIGDPQALDMLSTWLEDRSIAVRVMTVGAMGLLGTRAAGELLAECVADPSVDVRVALASAMGSYPAVSLRATIELLGKDPVVEVRLALLASLAGRDDAVAVDTITSFVADPEEAVREQAMLGLLQAGTVPALELFHASFEKLSPAVSRSLRQIPPGHAILTGLEQKVREDTDPDVRVAAMRALVRIEQMTAATVLTAMQDPEPQVRIAAIDASPMVDDPQVRAMLDHLMNDPVPEVHTRIRRGKLRLFKN